MTEIRLGRSIGRVTEHIPHEFRAIAEDATILAMIVVAATCADELALALLGEHIPPVIEGLLTASLWVMCGIYVVAVLSTMRTLVAERLLPRRADGVVAAMPKVRRREAGRADEPVRGDHPLSVLVVDDDTLASTAVRQVLALDARIGHVCTANCPDAAIAKIQSGPECEAPDVVLLDVNYAGQEKTGIDALTELHEASPRSKLVIMSVCCEPATVKAALVNDADGFIWKNESAVDFAEAVVGAAHHEFIASKSIARELLEPA